MMGTNSVRATAFTNDVPDSNRFTCDKIKDLFAEMDMQVTVEMYGDGRVKVIGYVMDFERLLGGL